MDKINTQIKGIISIFKLASTPDSLQMYDAK